MMASSRLLGPQPLQQHRSPVPISALFQLHHVAPIGSCPTGQRDRRVSNGSDVPACRIGPICTSRRRRVASACLGATTGSGGKQRLELDVAGRQMVIETGEIGRQANGAIMASMGETVIYTTACAAPNASGDGSFVPLTVNYAERFSAAGRTSGGYLKRDGRPRDAETLLSRLVDRPLRPLFTKGWANETQVLQWVLSYDEGVPPEALAITAASAALLVSDIPFEKAVAGVRVGWINGAPVINPSAAELDRSSLDLVLAGTRSAVLMIEGFCDLLTEEQMMQAITVGSQVVADMCRQIEAWAQRVSKPKDLSQLVLLPQGLEDQVMGLVGDQLRDIYSRSSTKEERSAAQAAATARAKQQLLQQGGGVTEMQLQVALKSVSSDVMRQVVLKQGRRMDGRGLQDIRPISSRANLLPRTHGSCLFTRGETQAIAVATLGSKSDSQKADSMRTDGPEDSMFYLHYFFPPSSVGEVGRMGGPGRRELGHGELAQRALAPVIPSQAEFPYTVRVESTVTESNGSSSMATVCGGCLAMMDAGVPLLRPVAGVAMGLILDQKTGKFVVLSDILGTEDALGDMDFKVAGDSQGCLTAFQMDIKVEGITLPIMAQALAQARSGREHVLREMAKCDPAPRGKIADFAPHVMRLKIDPSKKALVIGVGGRTVRQICDATGATNITITDDGTMEISAPGLSAATAAHDLVQLLTEPLQQGRIFRGARVNSIQAFGVFVELGPGVAGLVHVSELDLTLVADTASKWKVGDLMDVLVLDSSSGKIALSRRAVLLSDKGQPFVPKGKPAVPSVKSTPSSVQMDDESERGSRGGRGGRGGAARRTTSV